MTIGIYCIFNKITYKRYIGKSIIIENRFWHHKNSLIKPIRSKDCNRYLYNAVQKYEIENFEFQILETFPEINEDELKEAELKWMDLFKTCERDFGYNLRRDSSSQSFVHKETLILMSENSVGTKNPNYGNRWGNKQKEAMSKIQKERHASKKIYDEKWRETIGIRTTNVWKNEELKNQMALNVSKAKSTHDFHKINRLTGELIKIYTSIKHILSENPEYKWQNIYAACNGNKRDYKGYIWKRLPKNSIL